MSKEIIIDGVDVSGCVQLIEEPFYPCGLGGECKGWENCYYKQLKRLEQENAGLKAYKDVNEDFKTAWEELKAENERLKEENFNFEEIIKLCRCEQYQQTLQEIKEIIHEQLMWQGQLPQCELEILRKIIKAEEE